MPAPIIALIGAGRMGAALVRGWLAAGTQSQIIIVTPRPSDEVSGWAAAGKITLNPEPAPADIVVLSVKPQVFASTIEDTSPLIGPDTLVVSVMAGVLVKQLAVIRVDTRGAGHAQHTGRHRAGCHRDYRAAGR
ncbi:pyrroline-5-carboxylate reductase family protein [Hyphomonas sp.]|jgi:pyrroline-5-carboxylate reductase|uniref:pyrroline-5-carboxylate reductase family protein n=1 Tax=Hyphomonas sp. TaxID=87 RepID=UPI0039E5C584